MAPMAFSDSKLNESEFKEATYKRGLAIVEAQLITYRKNEVLFSEEVAVLKREVACKNYEINVLKSELEKVKQEKDGIDFKIEKFDKASKDVDQLLGSQINDKSKKGLGYSAVPPSHHLIYNRPNKLDLSYSEEQVSQDKSGFVKFSPNVDKETVFLVNKKVEFTKPKNHEKLVKKSVRFKDFDGGYVAFGGGAYGETILVAGAQSWVLVNFWCLIYDTREEASRSISVNGVRVRDVARCVVAVGISSHLLPDREAEEPRGVMQRSKSIENTLTSSDPTGAQFSENQDADHLTTSLHRWVQVKCATQMHGFLAGVSQGHSTHSVRRENFCSEILVIAQHKVYEQHYRNADLLDMAVGQVCGGLRDGVDLVGSVVRQTFLPRYTPAQGDIQHASLEQDKPSLETSGGVTSERDVRVELGVMILMNGRELKVWFAAECLLAIDERGDTDAVSSLGASGGADEWVVEVRCHPMSTEGTMTVDMISVRMECGDRGMYNSREIEERVSGLLLDEWTSGREGLDLIHLESARRYIVLGTLDSVGSEHIGKESASQVDGWWAKFSLILSRLSYERKYLGLEIHRIIISIFVENVREQSELGKNKRRQVRVSCVYTIIEGTVVLGLVTLSLASKWSASLGRQISYGLDVNVDRVDRFDACEIIQYRASEKYLSTWGERGDLESRGTVMLKYRSTTGRLGVESRGGGTLVRSSVEREEYDKFETRDRRLESVSRGAIDFLRYILRSGSVVVMESSCDHVLLSEDCVVGCGDEGRVDCSREAVGVWSGVRHECDLLVGGERGALYIRAYIGEGVVGIWRGIGCWGGRRLRHIGGYRGLFSRLVGAEVGLKVSGGECIFTKSSGATSGVFIACIHQSSGVYSAAHIRRGCGCEWDSGGGAIVQWRERGVSSADVGGAFESLREIKLGKGGWPQVHGTSVDICRMKSASALFMSLRIHVEGIHIVTLSEGAEQAVFKLSQTDLERDMVGLELYEGVLLHGQSWKCGSLLSRTHSVTVSQVETCGRDAGEHTLSLFVDWRRDMGVQKRGHRGWGERLRRGEADTYTEMMRPAWAYSHKRSISEDAPRSVSGVMCGECGGVVMLGLYVRTDLLVRGSVSEMRPDKGLVRMYRKIDMMISNLNDKLFLRFFRVLDMNECSSKLSEAYLQRVLIEECELDRWWDSVDEDFDELRLDSCTGKWEHCGQYADTRSIRVYRVSFAGESSGESGGGERGSWVRIIWGRSGVVTLTLSVLALDIRMRVSFCGVYAVSALHASDTCILRTLSVRMRRRSLMSFNKECLSALFGHKYKRCLSERDGAVWRRLGSNWRSTMGTSWSNLDNWVGWGEVGEGVLEDDFGVEGGKGIRQPPWETRSLTRTLETTPNLAMKAIGIPSSSSVAQYEDEGWNDAIIPVEMSLNYENPDIEQLLGIMERKVDTLMKDVISLMGRSKSIFWMTTNEMYQPPSEPSRQEEFEDIVMNFILDQEERVKQLEEYMKVIIGDFMQLSSEVTRGLKEKIREEAERTIDQSAGGKLRDRNAEESWALLEDLALYDNKSWNDPRDFAKPVKAISLPQDVSSTSERRLIELEHQVQCLMEAYITPMQPTQVNKITSSCEICSGPHDTQYCMENPEQAFVE
ncbi:hypothetical protein Tco_1337503 [Tanacetum coccineum]